MGEIKHSDIKPGVGAGKGVHVGYALEYNNHSDKESGTNELNGQVLSDEYIGKDARIHSDNSRWMLVQVTPTILWVRVGGDESLNETTENFDIYLDPIGGDDDINDGSELYPYKSFGRMFQDIPENVKHKIRVYPKAGVYTEENIYFERNYIGEGQLIIDASEEIYPVIAGPFTVASSSGVGPSGPDGRSLAEDIQASGVSWVNDELYSYHLYALTGNWAGYCLPVFKNTVDTIRTLSDWYNFQPGDTFNVVDCPVDIRVNGYVWIKGNLDTVSNSMTSANVNDPQESPYRSFILMSGIKITANITRKKKFPFRFEKFVSTFSFCTLVNDDVGIVQSTDKYIIDGYKWHINNQPIKTDVFKNEKLTDWYLFSLQIANKTVSSSLWDDVALVNCKAVSLVCRGGISLGSLGDVCGTTTLLYSMASRLVSTSGEKNAVNYLYLEQTNGTKEAINLVTGNLSINSIYIYNCTFVVEMFYGVTILANWLKAGTLTDNYAVHLQDASKFIRRSVNVDVLGVLGAIYFVFNGSTHAAWPASGNQVDDGAGCRVISEFHVP